MKFLTVALLLFFVVSNAQAQSDKPKYDEALAKSLGADDYGMKSYIFVILKTGSIQITDKEKVNSLFKGHLENIDRLAKEGKLVVAGPFGKNDKSYRGLFILNVKTAAEADKLLETDPAIKEKLLEPELFTWYGSAALSEYLKAHDKIQKKEF